MSERSRDSALRLVGRVYWPRIVGLGFATLAVGVLLAQNQAAWPSWALLILWGLIWPHLANYRAQRSAQPLRAEIVNLYVDAFMIGFWVPAMAFNALPSIGLLYMHLLSIMSVLGLRACLLGLLAEAGGVVVGLAVFGFDFRPESQAIHLMISLPMLALYPLYVGFNAYSLSVLLSNKQKKLKQMNRLDGLTGLFNRIHWEEQVSLEFQRVRRGGPAASLIFIDLDWFKSINDRWGHLVGDEVLRNVAKLMTENARSFDVCGRYGGEEFVVLLPDTGLKAAKAAAERLRSQIEERSLHPKLDIHATISTGVARINEDDASYSHWLDRADQALYAAKQQGRNRTVCAD
jgi:diguanylate cyclase